MKRKIFLFALFILMVLPFILLFSGSLMGKRELLEVYGPVLADHGEQAWICWFPQYPTLRAYVELLLDTPEYFTAFWNTLFTTLGVLAGQLFIAVPTAWVFARYKFRGKMIIRLGYMVFLILPFQVTMVSEYLVLDACKVLDTWLAVILPGIFSALPVFILERSFQAIPEEILEAARIDGAGELRIFFDIGLWLAWPGIFALLVLGFLEYWNAMERPLIYLKTETLKPLSLYLPVMIRGETQTAFTASIVTMLPPVLLFFCGQESLKKGIGAQ